MIRFVGNVLWLVFFGVWIALGYLAAALLSFLLIVTIPFGVAALRLAWFSLWPYGRTVVRRVDAGAPSTIGNVLWFLLAGLWLALGHLVAGFLLCLTIIGIPFGIAQFKLMVAAVNPLGKAVVGIHSAAGQLGYYPAPLAYPYPALAASGYPEPQPAGAVYPASGYGATAYPAPYPAPYPAHGPYASYPGPYAPAALSPAPYGAPGTPGRTIPYENPYARAS